MAVKWIELVWKLDLTSTQILVAQAVADYAHKDTGLAWMSQESLAWKTGLSVRTIGTTLKDLVKLEVLIMVRPARQHYTARYRFSEETPAARKSPQPDRKELPLSDRKEAPSDQKLTRPDRKSTALRPEGASTKPLGTVYEPSSTDRDEARQIVKALAVDGKKFTNRGAYEAEVARRLGEERWQREQTEKAATLIAECERCDHRGFYYEETSGSAPVESRFTCTHE